MFSRYPTRAVFPLVLLAFITGCQEAPTAPAALAPTLSVVPVAQAAFSGVACIESTWSEVVRQTGGGVVHTRNRTQYRLVTGNRLVDGIITGEGVAHDNSAHYVTQERATMVLVPAELSGSTWQIVTTFRSTPNAPGLGRGAGRGTGDLAGLTLHWDWEAGGGIDVYPLPEGCVVAYIVTGTIRGGAN